MAQASNLPQGGGGFTGVISNIWDQFRGNTPAGAPIPPVGPPAGTPNFQQNPGVPQAGQTDPQNSLIPPGGMGEPSAPQGGESPLAQFKDLWDNPDLKPGEQRPTDWNNPLSIVPNQNIDPAKVQEAARRIDFSRVLNQEQVKAALSGDTNAFGAVINQVAQAAFANNAMLSSRIVDSALRAMAPRLINEALPHHMKRFGVNEGLATENPIFNNPAVAPMLESLKTQFQNKYPKSSAAEITKMAKDYVLQFANAVGGTPGNDGISGRNQARQTPEIDWISDFLEQPTPNQQNQPPQF